MSRLAATLALVVATSVLGASGAADDEVRLARIVVNAELLIYA